MPERSIVVDTTPLIALAAATGSLDVLRTLYGRVIVPLEVESELRAAGPDGLGLTEFLQATQWLERRTAPIVISEYLRHTLDTGEAAVIQTALDESITLVCIDEVVGRRVARLCGLTLTGSIGVLIKAKQDGYGISLADALNRMRDKGLWLSEEVLKFALSFDR